MKIVLCDLTHETVTLSIDSMPVGIGYIASYAFKYFENNCTIELIKSPSELSDYLKQNKVDIVGFSNYCWNVNLSCNYARYIKSISQNVVTVMGGPNMSNQEHDREVFLSKHPEIDFYIHEEGEKGFLEILKRYTESKSLEEMKSRKIPGVMFLTPLGNLLFGGSLERIKQLDEIPSPYLEGLMDKFFKQMLNPMIQTNRGCPFSCTFCHEGDREYFVKVNSFSVERVIEELEYIGNKIYNQTVLTISDSNFLMYKDDHIICNKIRELQNKINYPKVINVTTGKNQPDRILKGIATLAPGSLTMTASVQSMNRDVLDNIKRSNISLDDFIEIQKKLHKSNPDYKNMSEIILPLPGESINTFYNGVRALINSRVDNILSYTLMMLDGTELNTKEVREKYQYVTKYRMIPRSYGIYNQSKVFEIEEVGVSTRDLTFDDYIECRVFSLFIASTYNHGVFDALIKYLRSLSLDPFEFILEGFSSLKENPKLWSIFLDFKSETIDELFDSEEELISYFSNDDNYDELTSGKHGGNLLQRYWVKTYVNNYELLTEFIFNIYGRILFKSYDSNIIKEELRDLKTYLKLKREGVYSLSNNKLTASFKHDVPLWMSSNEVGKLSDYNSSEVQYQAKIDNSKKSQLSKLYKQFGDNEQSVGKISTRLHVSQFHREFYKI